MNGNPQFNNDELNNASEAENRPQDEPRQAEAEPAGEQRKNAALGRESAGGADKPFKFTVSGVLSAIVGFWRDLERKTKVFAVVTAVVVVALCVFLAAIFNRDEMVIIYSATDNSEIGVILNILETSNIKYSYDSNLNIVRVRQSSAGRAVGTLASLGYPKSGFVYDQYNSSSSLFSFKTEAEKKQDWINGRQSMLSTAINTITGINYSIVQLNIADNSGAITQSEYKDNTASVILHLDPGFSLSAEAIKGIEGIVMRSVAELSAENITITNGSGVQLNHWESAENTAFNNLKAQYEAEEAARIAKKVTEFFEVIFGAGNVTADANVYLDMDKLIKEVTTYIPSYVDEETGEPKGIIVGEAVDSNRSSTDVDDVSGPAGTALNDDDLEYVTGDDGEYTVYSNDYHMTREYLVSTSVEQIQKQSPGVIDVTVSLAINTRELTDEDEERYINAIATMTGIQYVAYSGATEDDYIDYDYYRRFITIVPFNRAAISNPPAEERVGFTPPFGLTMLEFALAVAAILIIIIIILIAISKIRRSIRNKRKREREEAELQAAIDNSADVSDFSRAIAQHIIKEQGGEETSDYGAIPTIETKEQILTAQIRMFTEQNPEMAAQLIRTLIKEEGGS